MDNTKLAYFITSFGSMNDYSSTVLQTKRALDLHSVAELKNKNFDAGILNDAIDGIKAAKKYGFNREGIIAINKAFTNNKEEDPKIPGHLRDSTYNPDDATVIITDPNGTAKDAFFAKSKILPEDLDKIVDEFSNSSKTKKDAWRVFAKIAKLQPFQDGNKRTALIAANAAFNTWQKEDYLTLPFNSLDHADFMINLMRFYIAKDKTTEEKALNRMVEAIPSNEELEIHLASITKKESVNELKTKKVSEYFKNMNNGMDLD